MFSVRPWRLKPSAPNPEPIFDGEFAGFIVVGRTRV